MRTAKVLDLKPAIAAKVKRDGEKKAAQDCDLGVAGENIRKGW